jgi:peptidoglycan/xylan/chitin deacetylase (PgdA/CDA1 family)
VSLTFHGAGDDALLRRMLAELAAGQARVTVLAIGQWLAGDRSAATRILDGGHELGNHTWSHRTMTRLPASQVTTEIGRAADELRSLTGSPGRWFRPSGTPSSTATIRAAAVKAGYGACLGYGVDPMDYTDPGAATVLSRLETGLSPGAIVSLHLGHAGTVAAMPQILDLLRTRGLRAVTVSELLGGA